MEYRLKIIVLSPGYVAEKPGHPLQKFECEIWSNISLAAIAFGQLVIFFINSGF